MVQAGCQQRFPEPSLKMPQAPAYRPRKSWTTDCFPSFAAPPPHHQDNRFIDDSIMSNQNLVTEPGWRDPSGKLGYGLDYPVPIAGVAVNMNRRESAPESSYPPLPNPYDAINTPPTQTQATTAFTAPRQYPDGSLAPLGGRPDKFPSFLNPSLRSGAFSEKPGSIHPISETTAFSRGASIASNPAHLLARPEYDPLMSSLLVSAVRDVQIIKQVFAGWHNQLFTELAKHAKTETRANALEREILLEFENLQDKASLLSKTSEDMLEAFEKFVTANAQQCRRSDWRRNGSHFDPNADLERLSNKLVGGSSTVSKYVEKMRGKLLDIVKSIENAVHHAERKASRDKILRVFARALKIINLGAGAGASIAQVIPTAEALAAAAALGGIGALTGSAAKAVDKLRKDHYAETNFEATLKLLKEDIPDALKKAELSLGSLRACQKYLKLELSVHEALRRRPFDAAAAQKTLQKAGLTTEDVGPILFLTRSSM